MHRRRFCAGLALAGLGGALPALASPPRTLTDMPQERRDRHFVADGDGYVVNKQVRELCIFSPHNVLRDPPFSRIDLISCRNLLIYFGGEIQKQVIPTFHYSLRPGGYLFLGMIQLISAP